MLLLKNDPIWYDLKSDVLRIDALIEEISQKSVTGFIEFVFSKFSAAILLDEGRIIQCIKIINEEAYPVSKSEILRYLEEMEASVGLYKLKKETVSAMYRIINSEPVFENMNKQYVDAKKMLLTLEADKFSGVVTVRAERGECSVVLERGIPVCCLSKMNAVDYVECLREFLEILKEKDMLMSVYRGNEKSTVGARLKEVTREILGEHEKIEKMLEESGKSREELLKTAEEIEKLVYLFFDKKKTKMLLQRLRKAIEEGFSKEWKYTLLKDEENLSHEMEDETLSENEVMWFLQIACSSYYKS